MKYEFEVLECGVNPPSLRPSYYDYPLEAGHCFYIVSNDKNGLGSNVALEVASQPKYGGSYGIFDISLGTYRGPGNDYKPQ